MSTATRRRSEGAKLLDALKDYLLRYMVMTEEQASAVSLWVIHTHALAAAEASPLLHIHSPEKRSGKTLLLEVLALLVANPWFTARVTAAVLVRRLATEPTATLLLDESDAAFSGPRDYAEALRGTLNAGYRRGGVASLLVPKGGDWVPQDFPVFGPKAIAGIGRLPDTAADRAIPVSMRRKTGQEHVERFRRREAGPQAVKLKAEMEKWAAANVDALAKARPALPDELDDRAGEIWEPLLAIADKAGGDWRQTGRSVAIVLSTGQERQEESLGIRLLGDIRDVFNQKGASRMFSDDLAGALVKVEGSPWASTERAVFDKNRLATLLKAYRIRPKEVRIGPRTKRGYEKSMFIDNWQRYLPREPVGETAETPETESFKPSTVAPTSAS